MDAVSQEHQHMLRCLPSWILRWSVWSTSSFTWLWGTSFQPPFGGLGETQRWFSNLQRQMNLIQPFLSQEVLLPFLYFCYCDRWAHIRKTPAPACSLSRGSWKHASVPHFLNSRLNLQRLLWRWSRGYLTPTEIHPLGSSSLSSFSSFSSPWNLKYDLGGWGEKNQLLLYILCLLFG